MKTVLFNLILFVFLFTQGLAQDRFLIKVSPATPEETKLLSNSGVKAYTKTADYYLAEATSENLEFLKSNGISYEILDEEPEFAHYYFVWSKPGEDISTYLDQIEENATVLEAEGSRAIVKGHPRKLDKLSSPGLSLKLIKKRALPIKPEDESAILLKEKAQAFNPFIDQIIQKVTTSKLYDYVADLSGENQVQVGGAHETLLTRYTYTDGCDKAAQYLKEKFESFGLTAYYDSFTFSRLDTSIYNSDPYNILDIISTLDGNTAWISCVFLGSYQAPGILKTTDAGNNWYQADGVYSNLIWYLSAPTPDTLYGVGDTGKIVKSTNGGNTWFKLSSPTSVHLCGIYFLNSQKGWISGKGERILYTSNGGQDWIIQNPGTSYRYLWDITFVDSSNGWAVGSSGQILHTTNGGNNWNPQNSGTDRSLRAVDFATSNKGWVCGDDGYIGYTTDAGVTWNSQNSGTTEYLFSISAPDSLEVWAVGLDGTILHSTDAGINWISQSSDYRVGDFSAVYFLDNTKGWITGKNDILYTTDGGENWTQQLTDQYFQHEKYNVIAELPGQTEPGKECLITAHYDAISEHSYYYTPGADDNASGTAAVLAAAEILKDYQFEYTLKFICFSGEEQGHLGSESYAERAYLRGDTIIGVYNLDMLAFNSDIYNFIELHAGTGASSQALADITIGVINDYALELSPHKKIASASTFSDHASFWDYGYPAILEMEDLEDETPYYHTSNDLLSTFNLTYFTDFSKASIASVAILAQPLQTFTYGDANGNGEITISDVVYIISHLYKGGPPPDPFLAGDADCNTDVTASDVIYLINYLFKGGPLPGC